MLSSLKIETDIPEDNKLVDLFQKTQHLINILNQRGLPPETESAVEAEILALNQYKGNIRGRQRAYQKGYYEILKIIRTDLQLVPPNYYQTQWLAIGMAAFGIPLGVAFSAAMQNFGLIGLGLPLGLVLGMVVGRNMDAKAETEGRQLPL